MSDSDAPETSPPDHVWEAVGPLGQDHRYKVPGGWLYLVRSYTDAAEGLVYVLGGLLGGVVGKVAASQAALPRTADD